VAVGLEDRHGAVDLAAGFVDGAVDEDDPDQQI